MCIRDRFNFEAAEDIEVRLALFFIFESAAHNQPELFMIWRTDRAEFIYAITVINTPSSHTEYVSIFAKQDTIDIVNSTI